MGVPLYLPNAALVGKREAKREMRSEVMQTRVHSHTQYILYVKEGEIHRGREEVRWEDVRTHNQGYLNILSLIYRTIKGPFVQTHTEMLIPELIVLNR